MLIEGLTADCMPTILAGSNGIIHERPVYPEDKGNNHSELYLRNIQKPVSASPASLDIVKLLCKPHDSQQMTEEEYKALQKTSKSLIYTDPINKTQKYAVGATGNKVHAFRVSNQTA